MRRLLLLLSFAIALVAMAIPATSGAKVNHGKSHKKARVADRNHNGMPDKWERKFRVHKATADPDHDGVKNLGEFHNSTNPRDADSDNDGVNDGADDSNHDGIDDGDEQSGVIKSFDGTKLIVTLVNGDEVSGTVTDRTEIECDDQSPPSDPGTTIPGAAKTRHDDGSDDEPGEDHPSSSPPPADPTTTPSPQPPSDDEPGDDQGADDGDDDSEDNSANCGTAALVAGTIVREAELSLTSTGAIFHKIELGGKAPA